jgi:hypothetical protein
MRLPVPHLEYAFGKSLILPVYAQRPEAFPS